MNESNNAATITVPVTSENSAKNPHLLPENIAAITGVISKAVTAQCELNTIMAGADWECATLDYLKGFNFRRALLVEAAEAIAHTNYKWWAKGDTNVGQVYMELVDIAHFMISYFVVCRRTALLKNSNVEMGRELDDQARKDTAEMLAYGFDYATVALASGGIELDMDSLGDSIESMMFSILSFEESELDHYEFGDLVAAAAGLFICVFIIKGADYSVESFLNDYLSKSVLNRFRTSMGAKTYGVSLTVEEYREAKNSYLKVWRGREDNEWLTEVLEQLDASGEEFSVSRVESALRDIYMQVTAEALA